MTIPSPRFLFFFFLPLSVVVGACATGAPSPSDESEPAVRVGRILIHRKNVFETGTPLDKRFPYSWANAIHFVTTEDFIREELLFKEGDPLDPRRLEESERRLRSRPLFRFVSVRAETPLNGVADVDVVTEDVWTTNIDLDYNIEGGQTTYGAGVLEQNFLGRGQVVGAFVKQDIDRFVRGASFRDPHLAGSRWELDTGYGVDEKGREWEVDMDRPFYASFVPWAAESAVHVIDDEDRLFANGDEVATFHHATRDVRLGGAFALNPSLVRVRRLTFAAESQHDDFSDVAGARPPELPAHRTVAPFLVGMEFGNEIYAKEYAVRTFDRYEDIPLGARWTAEAGPSLDAWGATRDGAVGRADITKNVIITPGRPWFNEVLLDGRLEGGAVKNGVVRLRSQYYDTTWRPENTFSLRAELVASRELDPERQFLLGGENGLRGYSVRQFSGPNKFLSTVENRRTLAVDWLHVVSVGWAAFADSGIVWPAFGGASAAGWKSDAGMGLRLAPSRSVDPGLIRIDVAYALDENRRPNRWVFSLGADVRFGERRTKKFEQ